MWLHEPEEKVIHQPALLLPSNLINQYYPQCANAIIDSLQTYVCVASALMWAWGTRAVLLCLLQAVAYCQPSTVLQLPDSIADEGEKCNPPPGLRACVQMGLPNASFAFNGSYAIPSQTSLVLQGSGSLLDSGTDAPTTMWLEGDNTAAPLAAPTADPATPAFLVSAGRQGPWRLQVG